jgi:hypothetical protein
LLTSYHWPIRRSLTRLVLCVGVAIGLHAAMVAPAQASASCTAVNSGAFNLTGTALGASSSSPLFAWAVGDQITLTLASSDGISRTDGFYNGSFAALQTTTVPTTGSTTLTYTVVSADLTNGVLVDPENNDSVTATCAAGTPAPTVSGVSPNTGLTAGGTIVSITGTNLTGATAVNFGGNAATSFTVNSATSVTATSPAGSTGVVDVTVITPGGTSATSAADQFTYLAPPTVSAVSPNKGPTAGGTVVSITGTNLTGATAVNFGGNAATSMTVNSATSITATSPAGSAGVVDMTVITPGGTSATSAADQFTYFAPPTVTAVSPTSGTAAGGTTVTITGTNFNGATAVNFGGAAGSINANTGSSITATTPAHSVGIVDVTVRTPGGTSPTSAADQFTYQPPTRTWVSGVGDDTNSCSRTSPCKTFAGAISQTAAGGEIDCLDPGGFGSVTITMSITIDCEAASNGGVLINSGNGININTASAVNLRGLDFNGLATGGVAVSITAAATVNIKKSKIYGFAIGIQFAPTAAGGSLVVDDVLINTNGTGILLNGTGGAVNMTVRNSNINNNSTYGIIVQTTGGHAGATIKQSILSFNPGYGLLVTGGGAIAIIGGSTVVHNGTGVSAQSGGTLYSLKNNQIGGNNTDGTPLTAYPATGGTPAN